VHAVYVHENAQHVPHVYYRRINGCTGADVDASSAVNPIDIAVFSEALATGSARADVNNDGALDAADATAFMTSFNANYP
jgi:hypothetical protein